MAENPYIMSLITQTGVILTAVLTFITTLVQLHSNKKAKDSDKTLVELKKNVDYRLEENEKSNQAMKEATVAMLRSQIVSKCEKYQ